MAVKGFHIFEMFVTFIAFHFHLLGLSTKDWCKVIETAAIMDSHLMAIELMP